MTPKWKIAEAKKILGLRKSKRDGYYETAWNPAVFEVSEQELAKPQDVLGTVANHVRALFSEKAKALSILERAATKRQFVELINDE